MNERNFVDQAGEIEKSFENIRTLVKMDLLKDFFGTNDVSDEQIENWHNEHENKLIELFNNNPQLASEYMLSNRESYIAKIKDMLYEKKMAA